MTDPKVIALPFMFALMALEAWITARRGQPAYDKADFRTSMGMLGGNIVINLALKGSALAFYLWLYQFRVFDWGTGVGAAIANLIALDFVFYWFHRAGHRVRFLWAIHENHHSSEHMNLGTALRQPWLTGVVRPLFFWVLPLMGFDPYLTVLTGSIATIYGFWTHTETIGKLGPLEWIFVTPSHHRAHHGSNAQYLDKNYGNFLIVWDRLFGTFQAEDEPIRYGLTTPLKKQGVLYATFHEFMDMAKEWRRTNSLRDRLSILFGPPRAPEPEASQSTSTG